jgi:cell division protein FtsI/penicillin-binding protein 2
VDCERGYFVYKGRPLHDHAAYGLLTYLEAFAKSSNIGAVKLALLLGAEKLHHYLLAFGLGQPTGILLPHERAGLVRPLREWSPVSITSVPIGYEAAVTPLQLAMAMSALANDGRLMRPLLVDRVEDVQGQVRWRATNQVVRAVVRPEVARQFLPALKAAVSRQGTGGLAALSDFRVAGKTGTARKAKTRQAGYTRGGYEPGAYCATFCGFFPADAPEVCLLVILDEPRPQFYGGVTSARVFRRIGERVATYLHLAPDVGNLSTVAMHPMP